MIGLVRGVVGRPGGRRRSGTWGRADVDRQIPGDPARHGGQRRVVHVVLTPEEHGAAGSTHRHVHDRAIVQALQLRVDDRVGVQLQVHVGRGGAGLGRVLHHHVETLHLPHEIAGQAGQGGTHVGGHHDWQNRDGIDTVGPGRTTARKRNEQRDCRRQRRHGGDDPRGTEPDGRRGRQGQRKAPLHLARGREPPRGIRFERAIDGAHELVGQVRAKVAQQRARAVGVRRAQAVEIRGGIRVGARQQVKQQDTEAVDVAPRRRGAACQHLRREVERRAGERDDVGTLHAAGAEIHEDGASSVFAHDVLRLDVSVHEPRAVHRRKGAAQIHAEGCGFAGTEGAVGLHPGFERPAVHELHPQSGPAVADVGAVDRDHVRMPDARERARLVEQAIAAVPLWRRGGGA